MRIKKGRLVRGSPRCFSDCLGSSLYVGATALRLLDSHVSSGGGRGNSLRLLDQAEEPAPLAILRRERSGVDPLRNALVDHVLAGGRLTSRSRQLVANRPHASSLGTSLRAGHAILLRQRLTNNLRGLLGNRNSNSSVRPCVLLNDAGFVRPNETIIPLLLLPCQRQLYAHVR